ncbi:MAG: type II toxin-antitoxin system prevent-host-death family antitoxin [Bdellovibrio sp.]|nr:type II toxin-antitoxin system prevent-host-death family antitoxin [Bdellovibrio sp.]
MANKKMPAGQFKAQCLMVMDRVKKYGQAVVVTKHGKPVVKVVPAQNDSEEEKMSPFGSMSGTIEVQGDVVGSLSEKWDADEK